MYIKIGPYRKNRAFHIHIDNHDVWNLDRTLAAIIHPALILLKKTKQGYPELWEDGMHAEYDQQLAFDFFDYDVQNKYLEHKWDAVMDSMINAFGMILSDEFADWTSEERDQIDEGLAFFGKYYFSLWD
jgi:hypothetical protein